MEIFQPFFGYYFVNVLLIPLQLLHVFWSCLIIHMLYKFVLQGTAANPLAQHPKSSPSSPVRGCKQGYLQRRQCTRPHSPDPRRAGDAELSGGHPSGTSPGCPAAAGSVLSPGLATGKAAEVSRTPAL
ncbi:ceramide synthase 4-like [Cuculus canorus]|uniref:ceramide synthase 4-like n=1 Tax=Cuculus canorus TaxID=55661 RepID=UPI0023AA4692|nr:ceramide synthase 4-like [Cuculus canorus]